MTASIAAFDGQIGQTAYSASKGGVVGLTLPGGARPRPARHPGLHDRPGPVRHAAAGRPPRRGARGARRPGAASAAPRPARGVRAARLPHRREPDAERRDDPAGRRPPNAAEVSPAQGTATGGSTSTSTSTPTSASGSAPRSCGGAGAGWAAGGARSRAEPGALRVPPAPAAEPRAAFCSVRGHGCPRECPVAGRARASRSCLDALSALPRRACRNVTPLARGGTLQGRRVGRGRLRRPAPRQAAEGGGSTADDEHGRSDLDRGGPRPGRPSLPPAAAPPAAAPPPAPAAPRPPPAHSP